MPNSYLNFPFDPELFLLQWNNWEDPTKTAILQSGAMVTSPAIRQLISNGSDRYTIPFYDTIGGTPENYDGATNITTTAPTGSSQSGIVYGRAHGWSDMDFIHDFNSGADPMKQITSQVGKYWAKKRQATLVGILKAIFSIADDSTDKWDEWQNHITDLTIQDVGTVGDANKVGASTAGDALQKAVGDNSGIFSMAIMHSRIAANLAALDLLQFRKYTDPMGIQRSLPIADWNGLTVIVDDGVPVTTNAKVTTEKDYTTYMLGAGALLTAPAPVTTPVEIGRDRTTNGGYNYLITRMRETIHPNGFTFTPPSSGYTFSPTDVQLATAANWGLAGVPKAIAIAEIKSNG